MTYIGAIKYCYSHYATFAGRASRSEYWWWTLYAIVALIAAAIIDGMLGTQFAGVGGMVVRLHYGYVYSLVSLINLLPGLSVLVRRLHDRDKSGWWFWLLLVPLVGAIVLLVWFCMKGTTGPNQYGEDPLVRSGTGA
ncbi:MAG TPA: DUF805 domain-containing protein [Steroidobacteraceae bacterium]